MGPWDPVTIETANGAPNIEVHRVNTIETSIVLGALFAQGRINSEPLTGNEAPLSTIHQRVAGHLTGEPTRLHVDGREHEDVRHSSGPEPASAFRRSHAS